MKIIFIITVFLNSIAVADYKFENEFKCLREMAEKEHLKDSRFIDLYPSKTMLFFLNDNKEFGIYDRDFNPAVLQIEGNRIVVCKVVLNSRGQAKFMVDHGNEPDFAMQYVEDVAPHFRKLGGWSSTMPTIVGGAPNRKCKDVTGESQSQEKIKRIILDLIRKDMSKEKGKAAVENYVVSTSCGSSAGIKDYDLNELKKELLRGSSAPSKTPTTNAEDPG